MPEGCAIGGWHAAFLHGIPVLRFPDKVHIVSIKEGSRGRVRGYQRHFRQLGDDNFTNLQGIPVTSYRRAVLDVIRLDDPGAALSVVDHAFREETQATRLEPDLAMKRVVSVRAEYQRMLDAEPGRRGNKLARAVIRAGNPLAESPAESLGRLAALVTGLPEPELQVRVEMPDGVAYADMGWAIEVGGRTYWIFVEVDGALKYAGPGVTPQTFHDEKTREREILALGHKVLRFSFGELRERGCLGFVVRCLRYFLVRYWTGWSRVSS